MCLMASDGAQEFELGFRLDALRDHGHVQDARQRQHRPHDRLRLPIALALGQEETVQLDLVEVEFPEHSERGKARAEIVERDADAEALELLQRLDGRRRPVDEAAFRDFDLEPRRREAVALKMRLDACKEVRIGQLDRRHVHGDAAQVLPAGCLPAGAIEHPFPERADGARFLRDGDEHAGRDHPLRRVLPAQQHFVAAGGCGAQVHLGLIVQDHLSPRRSRLEVARHLGPGTRPLIHGRFVEAHRMQRIGLRAMHGKLGIGRQPLGRVAVLRIDRNPHARAKRHDGIDGQVAEQVREQRDEGPPAQVGLRADGDDKE